MKLTQQGHNFPGKFWDYLFGQAKACFQHVWPQKKPSVVFLGSQYWVSSRILEKLFGTFPGNQHLNTMKVLVKWDPIENHFTFKWSANISQQRTLHDHASRPRLRKPGKVCGRIPWRSLVVLPPGCRFKYSLQAQHQHLGFFPVAQTKLGGWSCLRHLMKLEIAPKITMIQKTCLSMSTLLNCTTFCSLQVLSFGDIQCLVWGICQKAVINRGISTTNLNWFLKHQEHYSCWWPSPCEQTAIHCRQEMIGRFRASELKPCYSSRKLLEILGNFWNPKPVEIHKIPDELCF